MYCKKLFGCFFWLFLLSGFGSRGQVRVPRLISDGMVLQRNTPIHIWGWASLGEEITVDFDGEKVKTTTNEDGRWLLTLNPKKAGGPYNMEIDGINHIEVRNVLVGDVWVCSGQSNMELPMERVREKYAEAIANSKNDLIRQFLVPVRYDFSGPRDNLSSGHWEAANPATVLSFSAVAYFFAKEIYDRYHVPVGLINNAVGGSPAEAWLSADALEEFPAELATAARFANSAYRDSISAADKAAGENWYERIWMEDKGLHDDKPWYDPSYDAGGWQQMNLPVFSWADQGGPAENGVVWFRKEIDVPAAMAGQPAKLLLGRIIDRDSVYINGVLAGTSGYQWLPRRYELPAGMLKPGKNVIVVRVINSSGRGGFDPGKTYSLTAGGQTIDLTGSWKYKVGMTTSPLPSTVSFQYQPEGLFNGMLVPLVNYTVKGVIWYQGEANTSRAAEYRRMFPALINNWRGRWRQAELPFLFVQLAGFMPVKDQPSESQWAELREAQRLTLSLPLTGMAVAMDLGSWSDVHPADKEDVGKRLFLSAERVAYGNKANIISSGPLFHSIRIRHDKVKIGFDEVESGLIVKGGGELHGFAVAGADNHFVWAKAVIEGKKVIAWSDQVPHPVAVRYAWADNPQGANLYNRDHLFKDGLPASPFEARKVPK
ncbi:MAG TPA: sialate O-acetylesterase [Puia sp.]|nr:sialate O-acetylesterase [Puia sp.]